MDSKGFVCRTVMPPGVMNPLEPQAIALSHGAVEDSYRSKSLDQIRNLVKKGPNGWMVRRFFWQLFMRDGEIVSQYEQTPNGTFLEVSFGRFCMQRGWDPKKPLRLVGVSSYRIWDFTTLSQGHLLEGRVPENAELQIFNTQTDSTGVEGGIGRTGSCTSIGFEGEITKFCHINQLTGDIQGLDTRQLPW